MTLFSASRIHDDIVLVLRKEEIKPDVPWKESQDFQIMPSGKNWLPEAERLPIKTVLLEDIAPEIAKLKAPDVHTADLLAWWILANKGGTVADMDIVFLKPLSSIERDAQVVVFTENPKPGYIPVSFMQGKPCWYWNMAYDNALKLYVPYSYESCGSNALTIKAAPGLREHIVFPWAGKYPWSLWRPWMFESKEWPEIPEDCCGIHWYGGHNQKWNQAIKDENNLGDGAIPWAIRKVMGI
jgi:hypothetical protein